jgi:hypothetical protein
MDAMNFTGTFLGRRKVTEKPARFHVIRQTERRESPYRTPADATELTIEWGSHDVMRRAPLVIFSIFWTFAMAAVAVPVAATFRAFPPLLIVVAYVALGTRISFAGLRALVNRTKMVLDQDRLRVHRGPLPEGRDHDLEADSIAGLFCTQVLGSTMTWPRTTSHFRLHAVLADGTCVVLANGLEDKDEAHFLENELRAALELPAPRANEGPLPASLA